MKLKPFKAWDNDNNCLVDLQQYPQLVIRFSGKITDGATTPNFTLISPPDPLLTEALEALRNLLALIKGEAPHLIEDDINVIAAEAILTKADKEINQ